LLGDKWELYLPSELAYGKRGSPPKIPGDSVLIFQMEIIKIKGKKVPRK
jgi:FKBP-type peptidyl-prolyl cis-trans isomerase